VQDCARARPLCFRRRRGCSGEQDDERWIIGCRRQLPAERETVEPGKLNVEQHDCGAPETGNLTRLLGRRHLLDLELVRGERLAKQQAKRRIVVHDEDPASADGPRITEELRRLHHG
jgi:hypothetical protein